MNDQAVLANHHLSGSTFNQAESHSGYLYPSRKMTLIEFSGAEGEDFRNFEEALESYFAMHNIMTDSRKLLILRAQLRRTAKNFFERRLAREPVLEPGLTYQEAIDILKVEYVTPELITRYTIGFNLLSQGKEEHPKTFLGRLQEAAQLAELEDAEQQIKIRFQVGLLPEIRKFCVLNSAVSFNDYLTKAEGWWNAEKPRSIFIKNSPFAPRDIDNSFVTEYATKPNLSFNNLSSGADFSVLDVSSQLNSALANLGTDRNALKQVIASLQTLELNHMENQNTLTGSPLNLSNHTENLDIKEMIREVMQEEFKRQNNNNNSSYRRNNSNYENRRYNNDYNYERRNDYSRGNDGRNYNNNNSNQRNNNQNNYDNGNVKKLIGSTVTTKNGQSNTPNNSKNSIPSNYNNNNNNKNEKQYLTTILAEDEESEEEQDLYAAVRPIHPPMVQTAKITKPYSRASSSKLLPTRKGKEKELPYAKVVNVNDDMNIDVPVTEPITDHDNPQITKVQVSPTIKTVKSTKPRRKREKPSINYDIVSSVFEQNSNIPVGDLLKVSPLMKRQFVSALRTPRQPKMVAPEVTTVNNVMVQDLSFVEDDDEDTTAIYTDFVINGYKIRTLIDGGAAKTCMSQELVNKLGIQIDSPSQSIFTLGNSTKQRGLGIIYDVPIRAGGVITIPGSIEVLPATPTPLIIGNNWLNRAKAVVNYERKLLSVTYKGKMAEIPINFFKTARKVAIQSVTKIPSKVVLPIVKSTQDEQEETHDDFVTDSSDEFTEDEVSTEESSTSTDEEDYFVEDTSPNKSVSFNLVEEDLKSDLFSIEPEVISEPYERTDEDLEAEGYDLNAIDINSISLEDLKTQEEKFATDLSEDQKDKIQIGEINDQTKQQFLDLIKNYQDVFDWNNDTLGCTPIIKHRVITEDVPPIRCRPYRMCPAEIESLKSELDKLSALGVIRPSNSPWSSPIILIKKKDNSYRLVIDYRKINAITKKDAYALPRIETLLDTLGNASIFSALDMRSGFYQVALAEDSIEKSAFATAQLGQWEFTRMPMGMCNSVGTFQRMVDLVFKNLINKSLVAYIDDLNCFSKSYDEHLIDLENLFVCVRQANLKLNVAKCFFFKEKLNFLGYVITKEGLETDPVKIEKVRNYPMPTSVTQIKGFIGIASYYRRFIKNFAAIARPLHNLTKKGQNTWNQESIEAFQILKEALTTTPVLMRPDFDKPFILVTDASRVGLGGILSQLDEEGHEHPIQYISRGLRGSEVNYGVSKLEGLAIIWAVKIFRPYLLGKKFTIVTDHSAINGLLKSQEPTGILARWISILNEYDYEVKYRPGRVNESADFLSRLGN